MNQNIITATTITTLKQKRGKVKNGFWQSQGEPSEALMLIAKMLNHHLKTNDKYDDELAEKAETMLKSLGFEIEETRDFKDAIKNQWAWMLTEQDVSQNFLNGCYAAKKAMRVTK